MNNPVVSVCITTFNKQDYIEQALDSILSQKTNFEIEVLIYDDASTDKTIQIIKKHQENYQNIHLFANSKNEYGNGILGINERHLFPKAKGKYIAMCDGDDYWSNETKLQLQVDFLEQNNQYIMCCHDGDVYYQKSNTFGPIYPTPFQNPITVAKIITMGGNLCPTSSIVFRNQFTEFPDFMMKSLSNDRALTYFLMLQGKFWYINQKMCVYRVHSSGLIAAGDKTVRLKYLVSNIELTNNFAHFCSNNLPLQKLIYAERANLAKNLFYFGNVKEFWHYKKYIRPLDWIKILIFKLLNKNN